MNTTQLEHLRLIDAHLAKLLDIAAKRTPGEWHVENISPARHDVIKESGGKITSIFRAHDGCHKYREAALPDAAFIASCAGNAEAGWRATRAAIAHLFIFADAGIPMSDPTQALLKSILATFPLKLIQKP